MPTRDRRAALPSLLRWGVALFAVGLVTIVITLIQFGLGDHNRPLAQNLLCVLAPVGLALAVYAAVRDGRQAQRDAAREITG
ncbi:MAG: hypothetical protein ACR2KJ_15600 [Jatrophihabitans sp.]